MLTIMPHLQIAAALKHAHAFMRLSLLALRMDALLICLLVSTTMCGH